MKRRTKAQKLADQFQAFKCIKEGRPVKRKGAKDGSIPTHSVVPVPPYKEALVLKQCLSWLEVEGYTCWRHDAGTFQNSRGQWGTYGMKNGGDIIGLMHNGRHLEIECKHGAGGRLSLGQQQRMKEVHDVNGVYFVIHGVPELEYYFGVLNNG